MRLTDEEILWHGQQCRDSNLLQCDYLKERLQSMLSVSQFRTRLYEARRQTTAEKSVARFIPIKVDGDGDGLRCSLHGKNSLSIEWKAKNFAEVRRFALAVLVG